MPALFGKDAAKAKLIAELGEEFKKVMRLYRLPPGVSAQMCGTLTLLTCRKKDFPDLEKMKVHLNDYNFTDFPK